MKAWTAWWSKQTGIIITENQHEGGMGLVTRSMHLPLWGLPPIYCHVWWACQMSSLLPLHAQVLRRKTSYFLNEHSLLGFCFPKPAVWEPSETLFVGWGEGAAVKSAEDSWRGPGFCSQHPSGDSQLPVTAIRGEPTLSSSLLRNRACGGQTCQQNTCVRKKKMFVFH